MFFYKEMTVFNLTILILFILTMKLKMLDWDRNKNIFGNSVTFLN